MNISEITSDHVDRTKPLVPFEEIERLLTAEESLGITFTKQKVGLGMVCWTSSSFVDVLF